MRHLVQRLLVIFILVCLLWGGVSPVWAERTISHAEVVAELEKNGVQLIELGETATVVLFTDKLFPKGSPRLLPRAQQALDWVASYIAGFRKDGVFVKSYTSDVGSALRNDSLSVQRAQWVISYLWARGIDARLAAARGFGESDPIATNASGWGRKQNDRIEIHFTMIPD